MAEFNLDEETSGQRVFDLDEEPAPKLNKTEQAIVNAETGTHGVPRIKAKDAKAMDYINSGAANFNAALMMIPDFVNSAINKAPVIATGGVSAAAEGVTPKLIADNNQERVLDYYREHGNPGVDNPLGKGIDRVGQEFGANAVPSGLLMRSAAKFAPGTAPSFDAMGPGGSFVDKLLASIAQSPSRAAKGEVAATLGSGTGASVAQQNFPGNHAAEAAGQVAGGFSPSIPALAKYTLTGQVIKHGADAIGDMLSSAAKPFAVENPTTSKEKLINWAAELGSARKEAKGRAVVQRVMGDELGTDEMAQLKQAEELKQEIPGFNPSVAEATGSPSLIAQQADLEARTSAGKDLNTIVRRREKNVEAIDTFAEKNAAGQEGSPEFVIDSASNRVTNLRQTLERQDKNASFERGTVADQLPVSDKEAAGITIKEQLDAAREARRRNLETRKDQLGLNDVDVTVPFTDIAQRLARKYTPESMFNDLNNYPEVLSKIKEAGAPVVVNVKNQGQAKFMEAVSRLGRNNGAANPVQAVYDAVKAAGGNAESVLTSNSTWDMATKIFGSARKGREWSDMAGPFQHLVNGVWEKMGVNLRMDPKQAARYVAATRGGSTTPPPALAEFRHRGVTPEGNILKDSKVSFDDLTALRERVSDDLIEARAGSPGGGPPKNKQIAMLAKLKEDIDGVIGDTLAKVHPDMRDAAKQYRMEYFKQLVQPFEQGVAAKVRGLDGQAFYRTQPEKVADAFFQKGNVGGAQQFKEIFSGNPEAQKALNDIVLDRVRQYAVKDGQIDPDRLTKWLGDHRSVLAHFPEISNQLVSVQAANDAIITRQAQLAARRQTIEDQLITRVTDAYSRGADAQSVIKGALRDPRKMGQLIASSRQTDGALPALQRNVWKQATTGDATDVIKFMSQHESSLKKLFTTEHLENIAKIAAARMMVERVPVAEGTAWVPRPLEAVEKQLGLTIPQALGRWHTTITGRSQKEYIIAETALRALRGRAALGADDAMRAALYDFNIARDFAKALEPGSMTMVKAKQLYGRLFALGIPLTERDK